MLLKLLIQTGSQLDDAQQKPLSAKLEILMQIAYFSLFFSAQGPAFLILAGNFADFEPKDLLTGSKCKANEKEMRKMADNHLELSKDNIRSRIYTIRGMHVMLDKDIAELYEVRATRLREQVKRNKKRFPPDFMFQLTNSEVEAMVSQNAIPSKMHLGGHLPYAFTEQGVAGLSGVLTNEKAINVNIQIMRAFVDMRRFISANAGVFQRLDVIERKQIEHDQKFEQVFDAIQSKDIKPDKGIFFEGQIFDAHKLVSDIIRSANKSIVLIDNYIDDSILLLLGKRNKTVQAVIFTKEISGQLLLDLEKHNSQYPFIEIKEFKQSHDRFLIIDNKDVYHFGASLKDLGKKWFAFSKFGKEALGMLDKLKI